MKYDVLNRYSGDVQFTADIDCKDSDSHSVKITAAIHWAIENKADLSGADLRWADLSEANLSWANLSGADLSEANLSRANLRWANLSGANLIGANLSWADLIGANGNNHELKTVQSGKYSITFSASVMAIGCEQHTIKQWFRFTKKQIAAMDHGALEWWTTWKPILKSIIEAQDDIS